MTPCERFRHYILDLLDDELDILSKKEVDSHLDECASCKKYYLQLYSLKNSLNNLAPIKASKNFQILLRERIRREIAGKRTLFGLFTDVPDYWKRLPAYGFFVMVLGVSAWIIKDKTSFFSPTGKVYPSAQSVNIPQGQFNGRIHYVSDELSDPLPVSRTNEQVMANNVSHDSLNTFEMDGPSQPPISRVSF